MPPAEHGAPAKKFILLDYSIFLICFPSIQDVIFSNTISARLSMDSLVSKPT